MLCMSGYALLPAFIGYFICMYACLKLSEYENKFKWSAGAFGAVGVLSLMKSVLQWTVFFDGNTLLADFAENIQPFWELVFYVGQWMLLPALLAIAKSTGRTKTVFACKRNGVLFFLMFVCYVVANILIRVEWEYSGYCLIYAVGSRFVVLILNLISVFSCYMWICAEGEEEKEQSESALNSGVSKFFKRKEDEIQKSSAEEPKWIKDQKRKKRK